VWIVQHNRFCWDALIHNIHALRRVLLAALSIVQVSPWKEPCHGIQNTEANNTTISELVDPLTD